jgi:tetratricopeptide (TPR) repeat protein
MALATFNSTVREAGRNPKPEGRNPKEGRGPKSEEGSIRVSDFGLVSAFGFRPLGFMVFLGFLCLMALAVVLRADETDADAKAREAFGQAKKEYEAHPEDGQAVWHFARATFDLADFATNKSERAALAQRGMAACKQALAKTPDSAPLHYYLGLNEGQLARTKTFGALKLVDQMESEFTKAIALDSSFDYAGAERSLGLLYRDAPVFGSIGSRTKARLHLEHALELAPQFPENRLNLVESELKWGDRKSARHELKLLEDAWPAARAQFTVAAWAASWADWETRLAKVKKTVEEPARLESPRH